MSPRDAPTHHEWMKHRIYVHMLYKDDKWFSLTDGRLQVPADSLHSDLPYSGHRDPECGG